MARDIKTNNKQHTASQLKKLCSRFILLDAAQRVAPLPANLSAAGTVDKDDIMD